VLRTGHGGSVNSAAVRRWSMADIKVRLLDDEEWQLYREVRLAALRDAPEAFVAGFEDEASRGEAYWRERMIRAHRIVAEREDGPVGVVCLGLHNEDPETGEVFGLWTAPTVRGARIARGLVSTAAQKAAEDGCRLLYFWAGSDNPSAVGFASSYGFRPTAERRPVRVADGATEKDADEVAMVLSLTADPTQTRNPYLT
jgi:ribosomal protein S18 acetylase RimI-like enzyme